jgi:CO/xanthine dehydrogenase Mo-binding subunit
VALAEPSRPATISINSLNRFSEGGVYQVNDFISARRSRREFLKSTAKTSGICVVVNYLEFSDDEAFAAPRAETAPKLHASAAWMDGPGRARHRYDGLAKVTGAKVYGRDFRAQDLPGWPTDELRVAILRTDRCSKVFAGADLAAVRRELNATRVVTAEDFAKSQLKVPFFFGRTMMAEAGKLPDYLGQPAALLFFETSDAYFDALPKLTDGGSYLRFGADGKAAVKGSYGQTRLLRYTDANGKDLYSHVSDGPVSAPWEKPDKDGSANARCVYYGELIDKECKESGWQVFSGEYATQVTDPMFMEPESGLGWYDAKSKTLHLTMGTQSPYEDGDACAAVFSAEQCPFKVETVQINACYPGGGFGGRDHSDIPLYLALAAVFAGGRPIRLVNSRFDQFQGGIKRHAAKIQETLAVDGEGRFQALKSAIELNGGGQNNFSFAVQAVAAQNASSGYYFPRCDIDSKANETIAVTAGSMRGFGTYQSIFALESLIDQAAERMQVDPIELRLKNLLVKGKKSPTGGTPTYEIQSKKLLDLAKASPLWTNRAEDRARHSKGDTLYGVGFALAVKSYGTNLDACLAELHIDTDGRIGVKTNAIDMGNGAATTLALTVASVLGKNADAMTLGATQDFSPLKLVSSFDDSQDKETEHARNPRWVPYLSMSMAASASAYQMRHAVIQAAEVVRRWGIWPAAQSLWGAKSNGLSFDAAKLRFENGKLHYKDLPPLAWPDLVKALYAGRFVCSAMVHTYYRAQWAKASFSIKGEVSTYPIDALALQYAGDRQFTLLDRQSVDFPSFKNVLIGVDLYTPYAALIAVEVRKSTGKARVVKAEAFLDCGPVIQREIVEGQVQGALAMGIGHALTEDLPADVGGAGEGGWNLHRYRVALAEDVPVHAQSLHIIDPIPGDPPKGIAEVVFCAIPPAVGNALAHATGKRFNSLPITAEQIKRALA